MKRVVKEALKNGAVSTFIAGSLQIASLSRSPSSLLRGFLLAKSTGYSLSKAASVSSRYSCKAMRSVLGKELNQAFDSVVPLLVSGGFPKRDAKETLSRSFWEAVSFWGCSRPKPRRATQLKSPTALGRARAVFEACTQRESSSCVSSLLADARSKRGDPLLKAVRFRALGWLPTRSPQSSRALTDALVDLTDGGISSNQEKLLARTLLLSLNRIGEPASQQRLRTVGPHLPKPLRPLWTRVLGTLRRLAPGDLPQLTALCKSKNPLLLERGLLELGRKKVGRERIQSLSPHWAVEAYPRSVGVAHRLALLWQ